MGLRKEKTLNCGKERLALKELEMKAYKISELEFVNRPDPDGAIHLENKYSYNVKYSEANICVGEFSVEIINKEDPKKLHLKLVAVGVFAYPAGASKEEVHVETYKELFPYARAAVSTITANSGIMPIIIPAIDIESQNIFRIEKPDLQ